MRILFPLLCQLTLVFHFQPATAQNEECVLVIQGARAKASEDFIRNSADIFISGMAATPPPPRITALRPSGPTEKGSRLGANPARQEEQYANKAELLQQIKNALCHADCKNVVIALIGHGIGSANNLDNKPTDKNAGAMKIGPGKGDDSVITAQEIARLIDSCQRSVKLVSAACYSESMINGILHHLHNKALVGVGVASSPWDSISIANGPGVSELHYDFIRYLLEDLYVILGDSNAMAEVRNRAAELKKQNDAYNESIKKINEDLAAAKKKCAEEYAALEAAQKALEDKMQETKNKIETAKKTIALLEERKELEKALETSKGKEKGELKKKLTENTKSLKDMGIVFKKGGKTVDDHIQAQKDMIEQWENDLVSLNEQWEQARDAVIAKWSECLKLDDQQPYAPIPVRTPLMEILIHEAFKSARIKTTSSTAKEPKAPNTSGVPMPTKPMTRIQVGDRHFRYYKVWDKINKKCQIVGYESNESGVPIGPIKSLECDTACNVARFSYRDGESEREVEIKKGEDGKYTIKKDTATISDARFYSYRAPLVLPGQWAVSLYYEVGFLEIPRLVIPGGQILGHSYTDEVLTVQFLYDGQPHQALVRFLEHDDVEITVDGHPPYLWSQVRCYTLFHEGGIPFGRACLVNRDGWIDGTFRSIMPWPPVFLEGWHSPDPEGYLSVQGFLGNGPLIIRSSGEFPNDLFWQSATTGGRMEADPGFAPAVLSAQFHSADADAHLVQWSLETGHLSDEDLAGFQGTRIFRVLAEGLEGEGILIPPGQEAILLPGAQQPDLVGYLLLPQQDNGIYDVVHDYPAPPTVGAPFFLPVGPVIANLSEGESEAQFRTDQSAPAPSLSVQPNPFRDRTTFSLHLPAESDVRLEIRTSSGIPVHIREDHFRAGVHAMDWDGSRWPHLGWYWYRLVAGGTVFTGTIIRQ